MRKSIRILALSALLLLILNIIATAQDENPQSEDNASASDAATTSETASTNTRQKVTYNITELGIVEVVDSWRDMKMDSGIFPYFTATKESGIIPVRVSGGKFAVSYATRSYLKHEEGKIYFVTPDFYYEDSALDIAITLHYPSNLAFLSANEAPLTNESSTLTWKFENVSHKVVIVEFNQVNPFAMPDYPTGPQWQVDPATLPELTAQDVPRSPDEAMKELETIIKMMEAQEDADPDLVRALRRTLSKFYYLFAVYGLVKDFVPEGMTVDNRETED